MNKLCVGCRAPIDPTKRSHAIYCTMSCKKRMLGRKAYRRNLVKVREKKAKQARDARAANPEVWREKGAYWQRVRALRKYGVSDQLHESLLSQTVCSCCGAEVSGISGSRTGVLHIDHDHTTGRFRGMICHHCNHMLGHARDNAEILMQGVTYLGKEPCA